MVKKDIMGLKPGQAVVSLILVFYDWLKAHGVSCFPARFLSFRGEKSMKKRQVSLLGLVVAVVITLTAGTIFAKTVTFESLLNEMVDRTDRASFPSPAYTCKQASSYDQHSVAPDKPGWFANNDRSYFVRSEKNDGREEWVMMDAEGPGAIVRWWVTSGAYVGTVRVYLDGAAEPVIEAKVDDLVGGTALVDTPLSEERARGRNLYLPIPYAKCCKVTFDRPNFQKSGDEHDLLYYQINYRTYAPGTEVESFSGSTIADSKAKIDAVQKQLLNPASVMPQKTEETAETSGVCQPGQSVALPEFEGPGAICKVSIKLDAKDLTQATRSIVLKGTFDGEQTIWCPVGDFFGSGVGINPFKGWYRQVEKDGTMTCWWVMPYKASAVLAAENVGTEPVTITATVATCPWTWTDRSMHFYTTWRQERDIKTKGNGGGKEDDAKDWNYLGVEGKGVFVGDTLVILNHHRAWWGEGDEKIYVDAEKFPSHFGTGTEDYYGYAWCTPQFFESPFHAQPRAEGPSNFGNTTNTRVRLLDDIPFTTSYQMDMEVWHWAATTINYAVATYWYGLPSAKANHTPQPEEAAQPVNYDTPYALKGFQVKAPPRGDLEIQDLRHFGNGWDEGDHLWWTGAKPGDKMTLVVPVKSSGKQDLVLKLTKAPDYAIVQFYVDGEKVGEPVDLYSAKVEPTGPMSLGTFDLSEGEHTLTVEILGANEKAQKRYMVGIDTIELKK